MRRVLDGATVVPAPENPPDEILFGATVIVRHGSGEQATYRIVGVDETSLAPGWVSWVSPLARALIGARVGQMVRLPDAPGDGPVEILRIG